MPGRGLQRFRGGRRKAAGRDYFLYGQLNRIQDFFIRYGAHIILPVTKMLRLESMKPCDLLILSILIAYAICDDLDAGTLNVLGNLIVAIGSLILTWAAQKEYLENLKKSKSPMSLSQIEEQLKALQNQCSLLEAK